MQRCAKRRGALRFEQAGAWHEQARKLSFRQRPTNSGDSPYVCEL